MKFLIVLALVAAATAVPLKRTSPSELEEIINAINSPSTDPATAAALNQMLQELLGGLPIDNSPAIVEEPVPIDNSPAIIEEPVPIDLNPALVEEQENISTDPAIVKPNPFNFKGPLVQVVVNVDSASDDVTVDQINNPEEGALKPDPVIIDDGEIKPDPVVVVDNEPEVDAENINVEAPSLTPEIANLPEDLN